MSNPLARHWQEQILFKWINIFSGGLFCSFTIPSFWSSSPTSSWSSKKPLLFFRNKTFDYCNSRTSSLPPHFYFILCFFPSLTSSCGFISTIYNLDNGLSNAWTERRPSELFTFCDPTLPNLDFREISVARVRVAFLFKFTLDQCDQIWRNVASLAKF